MFRVVLIGWLTLQQFPLGTSSAEVVLLSSAVPGAPSTPHHATVVKASVNAPDELKATVPAQYELVPAMGTVINVTFANGTFYGQYDIPEGADLNASLAAIANEADGLQADIVLLAQDSPLETTLKETSPPTTAPPATKTHPSTVERKDSATTSFEKMTTLSSAPEVGGSNMAVISVELGKLSIHPKPAIIENGRAVELFCSVGYSVSASIVWTLNDQPIEDVVLRSVISGRKDFLLKSNRIRVERLETLPAVEGKYVFECVASVDGVLLKEKVKLDSPYANSCSQDSDCRSRNAVCSPASKCVCDDAHPVKLNSSHVTCRTAAHLGWPCNYHEQCLHAANRSQCGSHGECSCVEMYRLDKSALGVAACVPQKTVNAPCISHEDCQEIGAFCGTTFTCQCKSGTLETDGRCVNSLPLGTGSGHSESPSVPGDNATNDDVASISPTPVNFTIGVKKAIPVRILKVREFPRNDAVGHERPPSRLPRTSASARLGIQIKVDVPGHENETVLGSQRMLTAKGCGMCGLPQLVSVLSAFILLGCPLEHYDLHWRS
ncbi:uncharacterized protein LOC121836312 [Ixodes scapularis]|uniref:uncharacterized protein LOC121836312 n=1 Tax=Ixodes scapularis TaxID=6945 RepID=UPI001C37E8D4|nr:uncharacterized protein LOC121836312 [Ixodes scapularis]